MADRPTRILILGGGFGGVYTALTLEKLLKREIRDRRVELGLISRDNYIVFQPMLPEVISGSIGILDTITPIRRLCPSTNLYTRTVDKIDLDRKRVSAAAGFGSRQCALEYDHLVIALGNVTSFAGQPGLAEYALPFKYLGDALALRNRIIHTLEEADIERDPEVYKTLLTFVVAGGGFSGVEAVAELNDFVRSAAKAFRNVKPAEIRVILLHAQALILPELPKSLAEFVRAAAPHEAGRRAPAQHAPPRRDGGRRPPGRRRAHSDADAREHGALGAKPARGRAPGEEGEGPDHRRPAPRAA